MTDIEVTYTLKATRKFNSLTRECIGWEPAVMKCENGKEVGIIGGLLPGMDALPTPEEALRAAVGKETTFISNNQGYRFKGDGTYHAAHITVQTRFVDAGYFLGD